MINSHFTVSDHNVDETIILRLSVFQHPSLPTSPFILEQQTVGKCSVYSLKKVFLQITRLKIKSKDSFKLLFFFLFPVFFILWCAMGTVVVMKRGITFHKNRNLNSKIVCMEKCRIGQHIRNTSAWPIVVRPSWITVSPVCSLHSTLMIHLDNIEAHKANTQHNINLDIK